MIKQLKDLKKGARVKFTRNARKQYQLIGFEDSYNHFDNGSYRVAKLKRLGVEGLELILRRVTTSVYLLPPQTESSNQLHINL